MLLHPLLDDSLMKDLKISLGLQIVCHNLKLTILKDQIIRSCFHPSCFSFDISISSSAITRANQLLLLVVLSEFNYEIFCF